MQQFTFNLSVSTDEWLSYYRGETTHVVATATDGRTVKFAAKHLQRYVSRDGIVGTFQLTIDGESNFVSLDRVRIS